MVIFLKLILVVVDVGIADIMKSNYPIWFGTEYFGVVVVISILLPAISFCRLCIKGEGWGGLRGG